MSSAADASSENLKDAVWAQIRISDSRDLPNIRRLIRQMSEFERLTHLFSATEASLYATLFPSPAPPPFRSFTVLILELSPTPFPISDADRGFSPIVSQLHLHAPVEDAEAGEFASPRGGGAVVVGFVLCFPSYTSFLAKSGMYVEGIFVRMAWRRRGLGRMMLAAVARQAALLGMGSVEWCVLDWNVNAIKFYEKMGAEVSPMLRLCRLDGPALQAYRHQLHDQQGASVAKEE